MTLYKAMKDLFKNDDSQWNYYGKVMTNPFGNFFVADFIQKFFDFGGKGNVITYLYNEMEPMRHSHTMSAYFLGLLLKQQVSPNLEIIDNFEDGNYEFSYLWFLVCLFHDMGYIQENEWKYKFKYRQDTEHYIREYHSVLHRGFPRRYEYEDLGVLFCAPQNFSNRFDKCRREPNQIFDGIYFNNGTIIRRSRYRKNTILNYLEYCKMHQGIRHYDHGIVGGLWLYDNLIKNYYKHYMSLTSDEKKIFTEDFFYQDGLLFSKKQWKIFAYLADCIISHNMWPASNETNECYIQCGLSQLSLEQFKTISFGENPILFLLAIADTLEPIKTYSESGLTDREILQGINIDICSKSIVLMIADPRMPFDKMAHKVMGIEKWLSVNADIDYHNRKITVNFSNKICESDLSI